MSSNHDESDPFGLKAEERIRASNVRQIFTPHKPVDHIAHFFGRKDEVRRLVSQILTPGQHSLLYGERGIGKSSLAMISAEVLLGRVTLGKVYPKRCDSTDTFETIVAPPLKHFGVLDYPDEIEVQSASGRESRLSLYGGQAALMNSKSRLERWKRENDFSPSHVANLLAKRHGLLVIDEADSIRKDIDRTKLAELIKHLSDSASPFKVLVVGIAETGTDLLARHPSVQRCLKETRLRKMTENEIREIIVRGGERAGLAFENEAVDEVVNLSAGYPYFTHLLCLKAGEEVIARDQNVITLNVLQKAMGAAVDDAENTLRNIFENATRSTSTNMYLLVLYAAAIIDRPEFTSEQWRDSVYDVTGEAIEQNGLNNYLKRLVTDESTAVIERIAKGMYRFRDPRMVSFVRIAAHRGLS